MNMPKQETQETQLSTTSPQLPANLPAGAVAFQAAVDGVLTQAVWKEILGAQVDKARSGDRGAARFLLEYAGGVASMRGATFVQENHQHSHYHESDAAKTPAAGGDDDDGLTPDAFERRRARHLQRTSARMAAKAGDRA